MVRSSADIVLQNRRISQSETSTISICDVVNTIWRCSMRGLAAMKMSLLQKFRLLLDYRDIWIYPNERTMTCALMPTIPSRQIKRVVRLMVVTMNAVYLRRYFPDEKYGSIDYIL